MNSSAAIVIFSRSAAVEANRKKIFRHKKHDQRTVKGFIHHTIQVVSKFGLPYFLSYESSQAGTTFGERLSNAITQTFADGFSKLIFIDNHCPQLTSRVLQQALADLDEHEWVLGTTVKGGVYLIGVSASAFYKAVFEKIALQSSTVLSELQIRINDSDNTYTCLPDDIEIRRLTFCNLFSDN